MTAVRRRPWPPPLLRSLLCGTVLFLDGCHKKSEERESVAHTRAVIKVRVQKVELQKAARGEEAVATIRAKARAILEAKWSGRIAQFPVTSGQRVKAGELIAQLDAGEVAARLDQAELSLRQADRDWKRSSALFAKEAVTRVELEAAETRRHVADSALAEAKALLAYAKVIAPFAGVITTKWAEEGDLAAPGKPLVTLEDTSQLQLEAELPESFVSRMKLGSQWPVRVDGINEELGGVLSEIAPASDPVSRTFRAKFDLPTNAAVRPGQFARLVLPATDVESITVPGSALLRRGQLEIVFTVASGHAHLRLVTSGRRKGPDIEILSGLDVGERVVVEGAALLADGQRVEAN